MAEDLGSRIFRNGTRGGPNVAPSGLRVYIRVIRGSTGLLWGLYRASMELYSYELWMSTGCFCACRHQKSQQENLRKRAVLNSAGPLSV